MTRLRLRGRRSGIEVDREWIDVFTVRRGRLFSQEGFDERVDGLKAARNRGVAVRRADCRRAARAPAQKRWENVPLPMRSGAPLFLVRLGWQLARALAATGPGPVIVAVVEDHPPGRRRQYRSTA